MNRREGGRQAGEACIPKVHGSHPAAGVITVAAPAAEAGCGGEIARAEASLDPVFVLGSWALAFHSTGLLHLMGSV
jgi:hypothetical protein